jgi:hypothetical protein
MSILSDKGPGATAPKKSVGDADELDDLLGDAKGSNKPKAEAPKRSASSSSSSSSSEYSSMTVKELKDMLKAKGLPVGGVKAELVERLSKA